MVKITFKGETRNIPKRYLPDTLTESQRKKQIKSIFEGTDRPKLDKKTRKSSLTIDFNKKYGKELEKMDGGKSIKNISKIPKIPFKALKEVYEKGEAAYYSSGSRPNVPVAAWARGRLYKYILTKGKNLDTEITKKYKVKF